MNWKSLLLVLVCVSLVGCPSPGSETTTTTTPPIDESPTEQPDPDPTRTFGTTSAPEIWGLDMFVENLTSVEEGTYFSATIAIEGIFSGELRGVKYQALDRNRTVIREAQIGDISGSETVWINTTIPNSTRFVVLRVDEVENTLGDYDAYVYGVELMPDGRIEYQRTYGKENFTY